MVSALIAVIKRGGSRARRAVSFRVACGCCAVLFVGALVGSLWPAVQARQTRTVADGVYTEAQAKRGEALYRDQCAVCHGDMLEGLVGPPLTDDVLLMFWGGKPVGELVTKIQGTMPYLEPGTLKREQVVDIMAYMLQFGKQPAGTTELSADPAALAQIMLPAAPAASAAPAAATGDGSPVAFTPTGNLAQVMRAIAFPSSNIIFNVQSQDPGTQQQAGWQPGDQQFSWVNWGAGIYSPWELVDYAAIAIAESAPLLLTPGRRCENGKPVPVNNPDWIQYTKELIETGREGYRISQTRNAEAVGEFSNQLADACLKCHEVYRDKPGGTPEDPSNKAARCVK